jgi:hypothetical protein
MLSTIILAEPALFTRAPFGAEPEHFDEQNFGQCAPKQQLSLESYKLNDINST